jgi:hypothetical protein
MTKRLCVRALRIDGMSDDASLLRVRSVIESVPGVKARSVSLGNAVIACELQAACNTVLAALRSAGFGSCGFIEAPAGPPAHAAPRAKPAAPRTRRQPVASTPRETPGAVHPIGAPRPAVQKPAPKPRKDRKAPGEAAAPSALKAVVLPLTRKAPK